MSVLSLGQSYTRKVALSYVAVAVFKLFVACLHLGSFSCANASLQVVVVAKVEQIGPYLQVNIILVVYKSRNYSIHSCKIDKG